MRKLLFLLALTGCQSAPIDTGTNVGELRPEPWFTNVVHSSIAQRLRDPYSAHFGPYRAMAKIRDGNKEIVVCGFVNAKNGFGGYTGMEPYIGVYRQATSAFNLVMMGDAPDTAAAVLGSCRASGIAIS